VGEPVRLDVARLQLRSKRLAGLTSLRLRTNGPHRGISSPAVYGCLISPPNTAISKSLQERVRVLLATLNAREEQVLRMRFGIGEPLDQREEAIDRRFVLPRHRVFQIEIAALRKLRHPGQGRRVKRITQG
jgi:hypothetical protein